MEDNYTFVGDFSTPAVAAVLSIETVIGFVANIFVLSITLYQRKSLKQPSTIFFTSLILAHLLLLLVYLPLSIIAIGAEEWIFGSSSEEKRATCSFAGYIFWYCLMVITLTLDAISFDRFLFIVKPHLHKRFMRPWVALALTIAIWLLVAVLNSTPFFGLGVFRYENWFGSCIPVWISIDFIAYSLVIIFLLLSVIIITSLWTFCFTCQFMKEQSLLTTPDAYTSQKKRLFGIFGSMLIVYGICFTPGTILIILIPFVESPTELFLTSYICILFITVANPIVQSYFRPEIKSTLLAMCQRKQSNQFKSLELSKT